MRGLRLNPLAGAVLALAAASLAAMLLVERLAVPAGIVFAFAVLILAADGLLATDVPPGSKRLEVRPEDRPGPRRQRFDPTAPARVSAEVDDEAWRRERLRRRARS